MQMCVECLSDRFIAEQNLVITFGGLNNDYELLDSVEALNITFSTNDDDGNSTSEKDLAITMALCVGAILLIAMLLLLVYRHSKHRREAMEHEEASNRQRGNKYVRQYGGSLRNSEKEKRMALLADSVAKSEMITGSETAAERTAIIHAREEHIRLTQSSLKFVALAGRSATAAADGQGKSALKGRSSLQASSQQQSADEKHSGYAAVSVPSHSETKHPDSSSKEVTATESGTATKSATTLTTKTKMMELSVSGSEDIEEYRKSLTRYSDGSSSNEDESGSLYGRGTSAAADQQRTGVEMTQFDELEQSAYPKQSGSGLAVSEASPMHSAVSSVGHATVQTTIHHHSVDSAESESNSSDMFGQG